MKFVKKKKLVYFIDSLNIFFIYIFVFLALDELQISLFCFLLYIDCLFNVYKMSIQTYIFLDVINSFTYTYQNRTLMIFCKFLCVMILLFLLVLFYIYCLLD